jgi:Pup amidohydrolase
VFDRLIGTETEYALCYDPPAAGFHPGNETLYRALIDAVGRSVHTRPGRGVVDTLRTRVFTENGGSLYYEYVPHAPAGGLIEGGTPECRGPSQLLLYQRAQDALLARASVDVARDLSMRGLGGELRLLKNCRDAQGHTYGAQENYEVDIAQGGHLLFLRVVVASLLPLVAVVSVVHWLWIVLLVSIALTVTACALALDFALLITRGGRRHASSFLSQDIFSSQGFATRVLGRFETMVGVLLHAPVLLTFALTLRLVAYRPYRHGAMAFLASRSVVSGAGSLEPDGRFILSEKAGAIRRLMRWSILPSDRGFLETGHLMKPLISPVWLDWTSIRRLFDVRQRFQLGLADANLCDVAEYLKIGTTALVLDMVDAGVLEDAPQLSDPTTCAQHLSADDTLQATVTTTDGHSLTSLDIQRYYHSRAKEWLAGHTEVNLEAHEVVRLWGEILTALENDPDSLVGQLDWVTKRALIARCGEPTDGPAAKKVDLRYHELGSGYHAWLKEAGLTVNLLDEPAVQDAIRTPPGNTPATMRGRLIRELASTNTDASVSWEAVHIGPGLKGKVIRLDERRRR